MLKEGAGNLDLEAAGHLGTENTECCAVVKHRRDSEGHLVGEAFQHQTMMDFDPIDHWGSKAGEMWELVDRIGRFSEGHVG